MTAVRAHPPRRQAVRDAELLVALAEDRSTAARQRCREGSGSVRDVIEAHGREAVARQRRAMARLLAGRRASEARGGRDEA